MRNKGFFWFLTILLTAVCVYQLSFTWVAIGVENDAEKAANIQVEELRLKAKETGDSTLLPNGTYAHFNEPEGVELAKSAILNKILQEKADVAVYPLIDATFKDVKSRSLAFGLDLVGGMSVTLEISVPELIKSFAINPNDLSFKKPYESAYYIHTTKGGDFIDLFVQEYERMNKSRLIVKDLAITEVKELSFKSSNSEVESFFRDKVASSMDGVEQIMSKRINQFGVAQPNIQKESTSNRLYIELPGVQDEATVAAKLQSTANLQFFETFMWAEIQAPLAQANQLSRFPEVKIDPASIIADTVTLSKEDSLKKVKEDSAKLAAQPKPLTGASGKGLMDYLKFVYNGQMVEVKPEDKDAVTMLLRRNDIKALFPKELRFMWSANTEKSVNTKEKIYNLYLIRIPETGKALVGGSDIKNATRSFDGQKMEQTVDLTMTIDGADRWAEMTSKNVGKSIAITMDSVVYSAPNVISAITGGNTQITGGFSIAEADDLAGLLNGGALPAPCVIKDQSKVGPTIGAENSTSGLISFAFAFLAVFIYMYFYYGKGGLIANVALLINVVLIFGCLASFGAVLTLAGIAGIVLTIGTAVDANILIFERIKEEKAIGKSTEEALNIGFVKALPSIIDANVTHLLVAIILKVFGTGEIESFATTLIVGIFTSVFSAIIISKLIISSNIEKGKEVSFSTGMTHNWFSKTKINWVGSRKYYYIFSITITIVGVVALMTRGLKPSVEFTGGRTFGVKMEKPADIEKIRASLEKVFVEPNGEISSIDLKTKSNNYNVEITTNWKLADDGATAEVKEKLKEGLGNIKSDVGTYEITDSRSISASVSEEMLSSAAISISLALLAIFAYIFIRFGQWQYSLGAILGLAHDVMVVLTVFSLLHGILPFNMDINQAFIAAILTVIGYSMNDTVIVFDRVRESLNFNKETEDHQGIINDALNKTLSRTFNTSMILFVVLLIMFIFGGPAIKGFLFALLVGVVIGTYSSLCVATPILIDFTRRFKKKSA